LPILEWERELELDEFLTYPPIFFDLSESDLSESDLSESVSKIVSVLEFIKEAAAVKGEVELPSVELVNKKAT
jgi:hypothetical protein